MLSAMAYAATTVPADATGKLSDEEKAEGFKALFNGKDLQGWTPNGKNKEAFKVKDGNILVTGEKDGGYLMSNDEYDNFVVRYEYRCVSGNGNSGFAIRSPLDGDPAYKGFEIQVLKPGWPTPYQRACSLYHTVAPTVEADKPFGEWNSVEVYANGTNIRTTLNGKVIYDIQTTDFTKAKIDADKKADEWRLPLDDRPAKGHFGFQDHEDQVEFRNIRVKPIAAEAKK